MGREHMEDQGKDGRIISECIFEKQDLMTYTGFTWLMLE
jgi:hypothetical protein